MTYDFAGLGLDDFYKPLIPDPAPDVADQGDPYLLTVPDPSTTAYPYYLFHTDVSAEGDRIPVYGSRDLRTFDLLGKALPTGVRMSQHWAPCVVHNRRPGRFALAYVVEFWHEERAGVGVVEVDLSDDFSRPVSPPRVVVKPS